MWRTRRMSDPKRGIKGRVYLSDQQVPAVARGECPVVAADRPGSGYRIQALGGLHHGQASRQSKATEVQEEITATVCPIHQGLFLIGERRAQPFQNRRYSHPVVPPSAG